MLSTATHRDTSGTLSKSVSNKLYKTIRKQPFPITSPTSDKTLNIPIKNTQLSAQARKRKNDAARIYQAKVSPRSLASSLTSEIPCFDLNSFNEVGSSTSASNNNQLISQKSSSSSSCKPVIEFSPVLQPCGNPLAGLQFSGSQSLFTPKPIETFTRIDSPFRLLNWNLLPAEIQKAVVDLNGQVDELQHRFDEYVPLIEAPMDSRFALQKVIEAQKFQQSQVFKLANLKEGVSLQSAVDNLINQPNIFTSNKKSEKDISYSVKKYKKIRKDSEVQNNGNCLRTTTPGEQQQQIGKSDLEDKHNNLLFRETAPKLQPGMILSTAQEREVPGQFAGNHLQQQQAAELSMQFKFANNTNMMSPRKAVYDDDLMTQPEFIGVQQMNNNNQYDDFSGGTKLRRHQSDPFGYSCFNQQSYIHSMSCNPYHVPFKNHMDTLEGELSMAYEEESFFDGINHHRYINNQHQQLQQEAQMEQFRKDDEDDTLNRAYHSQNDTFEELLESQSKCCCNQQNGNKSNQPHELCCSSEPSIPMVSQNYNNNSFLNDSSPYHLHQSNTPHSFQAALHHSYPATQDFYSHKPYYQQQQIRREFDFPQDTQYTNSFGRIL